MNDCELNDRSQFKIIQLRIMTNREEKFDAGEELCDLTRYLTQQQIKKKKKEREQSSANAQNPLKIVMQDMEKNLELNQNFFLDNNVDHKQNIILKKTIKKRSSKKYSTTKVKSINDLTSISYNRLKSIDFDIASFINDCFTHILLNLNPFFLEQKLDYRSCR